MYYLKNAFRALRKNVQHTILNILGLAVGISAFILIMSYITNELSYDNFHKNSDNIYKVCLDKDFSTLAPLGHLLHNQFPEIKNIARLDRNYGFGEKVTLTDRTAINPKGITFKNIVFADSSFFNIFSFNSVYGNLETALKSPYTIVLTQNTANKLFGNLNPIGKTIGAIDERGRYNQDYVVTAVIEDVPANSSINFNGLASFSSLSLMKPNGSDVNGDWYNWGYDTYIQLNGATNIHEFEQKVNAYWISKSEKLKTNNSDIVSSISLVALNKVPFHNNNKRSFIYLLAGIGLLIVAIAIINFVNLTIAKFPASAKEIGVRKLLGSSKIKLTSQIMVETLLVSIFAVIIAILLAELIKPLANQLIGLRLSMDYWGQPLIIPLLLAGAILIGIIAGTYPAIYFSSFKPLKIIRNESMNTKKGAIFNYGLVLFQFLIAIIMIASTILIQKQVEFLKSKDLGFNDKNVISIQPNKQIADKYDMFRQKVLEHPGITDITASSMELGNGFNMEISSEFNGETKSFKVLTVDPDFVKTMNINLREGRNFTWDTETDKYRTVIINKTMAKEFGLDPAIDKEITMSSNIKAKVIGVMNDFHAESFHKTIEPSLLWYAPKVCGIGVINMKINPAYFENSIESVRKIWAEISPDIPFEYHFLNESYASLYKSEVTFSRLIGFCSILSIFISCLGLFGLITHIAKRRTKEIGIRKVNGARVSEILTMLNRDLVKWVAIAFVIATPVAWYAMNKWLENFAYKTNLSWWIFALAGLLALGIALLTVSWQSWKAATRNPVEALRYE